MKKLSMLVAIVVIVVVVSWSVVPAQQSELSVAPSVSSQSPDISTRYLLEIYVLPQVGPTYLLVGFRPGSAYFPRFVRIANLPKACQVCEQYSASVAPETAS